MPPNDIIMMRIIITTKIKSLQPFCLVEGIMNEEKTKDESSSY